MIRFISVLLFALTLGTAQAQTTVGWLTNATGLASLPPTSSRQAVSVGNESSGWSQWNWNAASTASTNSTVVAYTGLATGRWIQSPITGVAVGLTTATVPTVGNSVVNKTALDASAALALAKASNLSDLASSATARTNLGLGTLATQSGTFSGTSSGVNTGDQTTISGNAGTATALATARAINGVAFDGTAPITVTAAAGTLTGATLASGVTGSSLTSAAGGTFGTAAFISAASKLDVTNGVVVGLTTATVPSTGDSVVNKTALDAAISTNRTRSVASVAAMQALTGLASGDVVITAGRNTAGDGFGLNFAYVAASTVATNMGTRFASTASLPGRFEAIYEGPARFEWYGAVGNGVADCYQAITNAMAYHAIRSNGVTSQLRFGVGIFVHYGSITNTTSLDIAGVSSTYSQLPATRLVNSKPNSPGFVFGEGSQYGRLDNLLLQTAVYPALTETNSIAILAENDTSFHGVSGCSISGYNYSLVGVGQSYNYSFDDLFIHNAGRAWVKWNEGTLISINRPFFMNQVDSTTNQVVINSAVLSGTTNLTLNLASAPPGQVYVNSLITVTGLEPSGYNTRYFVKTIVGNVITVDTPYSIGPITDAVGLLDFWGSVMAETPITIGKDSNFSIEGGDFESLVLPDNGVIIDSKAGLFELTGTAHFERISGPGSWTVLRQSEDGMMAAGLVGLLSSSVPPGKSITILDAAHANATVNAGGVRIADIGATGASLILSTTTNVPSVVGTLVAGRASRANASYVLTQTNGAVILSSSGGTIIPTLNVTSTLNVTNTANVNGALNVNGAETVNGSSGQGALTVNGQSVNFTLTQNQFSDTVSDSAGTVYTRTRGTKASPGAILNNDSIFLLSGAGYNNAAGYNYSVGYVRLKAAENFTATAGGGIMDFAVTPPGVVNASVISLRLDGLAVNALVPLNLYSTTSDPVANLVDGQLWYRSDTDVFRGRANGATISLGTVSSASVTTANGVSATVATASTTPAFTFTLGAITPSSVASSGVVSVPSGSAFRYNSVNAIQAITANENWMFGSGGNLTMTGSYNTIVGLAAVAYTTGTGNVAVGPFAHFAATTANSNVAVGVSALANDTLGFGNIAIGRAALSDQNHTAVDGLGQNTAVGYNTGRGIVTGTNNTILGANVNGLTAGLSGNIILATGAGTIRAQHDGTGWTLNGTVTAASGFVGNASTASAVAVGGITGLGTGTATLLGGASSGTGGPVGTASPTFTGVVTSPTFTSTIATGTAPFTVASTTLVSNLNADRLDGLHKGGIQPASANLTNVAALTAQSLPSTIISVTENTQTGTTYTVLSTDNGKVVTLNNASAITVTVPTLSAGFSCTFIQKGAGQVTFSASGTTVSNAHSQTKTFGQYAAVTLYGLSSTTFVLAGDTGT